MTKHEEWLRSLSNYEDMVKVMDDYDHEVDYVGPGEDNWKTNLVPRKLCAVVDVNVCAYIHDYWYRVGGTEVDRVKADTLFLADMLKQIEIADIFWLYGWLIRRLARKQAMYYYGAVRTFGKLAFNHKKVRKTKKK